MSNLNGQQFEGYYHGTDKHAADAIMKEGFSTKFMTNGRDAGDGVYATKEIGWAAEHAFGMGDLDDPYEAQRARAGRVVEVSLHPKNPFVGTHRDPTILKEMGKDKPMEHEVSEHLVKRGHDAWIQPGSMALAFDPSIVKPKRVMNFKDVNGWSVDDEIRSRHENSW